MAAKIQEIPAIPVNHIFLHLQNPRFEPVETESEAIARLCSRENVYPLAADIVAHGLNPLERFAVVPIKPTKGKTDRTSYAAAEGNRRLCAIKLLNDPDLAPPKLKDAFTQLAVNWKPVRTVPGVVFEDEDDVRVWLQRIHGGEQGGIGRRRWNTEQQQRFTGAGRNKVAQDFLDYAERSELISPEERKGKITTVQRFMSNQVFREALGLDNSDQAQLKRTRPEADFEKLAKKFVSDLREGEDVSSRMNKPEILAYARKLGANKQITGERIAPTAIEDSAAKGGTAKRKGPTKPERARFISHEIQIEDALTRLGVYKLQSLYHSVTALALDDHTPLIAVGIWSFVETLTACAGRDASTDFCAFFSKDRLSRWVGTTGQGHVPLRTALERIRDFGNATKHHAVSAAFNGDQLNNDMQVLSPLILRTIEESIKIKP